MICPVWPVVVESVYDHNTDITWVASKAPTTPEDGNHLPKHAEVNLEYINL